MGDLQRRLAAVVQTLPDAFTETFGVIKEIDEYTLELAVRVREDVSTLQGMTAAQRETVGMPIEDKMIAMQGLAMEIADEKVNMVSQAYELLDVHIRRLDHQMKCLETAMKARGIQVDVVAAETEEVGASKGSPRKRNRKHGMDVMTELAIDPNEPLYCTCRQVSFGHMVACDDPDCAIEWFHYPCVGLAAPPPGVWYCPDCTTKHIRKPAKKQFRI